MFVRRQIYCAKGICMLEIAFPLRKHIQEQGDVSSEKGNTFFFPFNVLSNDSETNHLRMQDPINTNKIAPSLNLTYKQLASFTRLVYKRIQPFVNAQEHKPLRDDYARLYHILFFYMPVLCTLQKREPTRLEDTTFHCHTCKLQKEFLSD